MTETHNEVSGTVEGRRKTKKKKLSSLPHGSDILAQELAMSCGIALVRKP